MPDKKMVMMTEPEAVKLLDKFGINYPAHGLAKSAQEAMQIAESLGFPVVIKVVSPDVVHKSDAGGVRVNLKDTAEVKEAYNNILHAVHKYDPLANIEGMLVCRQAEPGLELVIGVTDDQIFGKTIMFGLGGVFVEVLKDVSLRIIPLDFSEAKSMINQIKGYPLIEGTRGGKKLDQTALIDLLLKVSRMVTQYPWIREIDLNPVCLYTKGAMVLDVRIMHDKFRIDNTI